MNITELKVGCRVVYAPTENEKQLAVIKAITDEGRVILSNTFGDMFDAAPDRIVKQFEQPKTASV